jgi:hypothetical protein
VGFSNLPTFPSFFEKISSRECAPSWREKISDLAYFISILFRRLERLERLEEGRKIKGFSHPTSIGQVGKVGALEGRGGMAKIVRAHDRGVGPGRTELNVLIFLQHRGPKIDAMHTGGAWS